MPKANTLSSCKPRKFYQDPEPRPTETSEKLSCNGVEMIREYVCKKDEDAKFVYDVYYTEEDNLEDFDDSLLEGLVSLQPFHTGAEFLYNEYR